jgi:hypothetical protein
MRKSCGGAPNANHRAPLVFLKHGANLRRKEWARDIIAVQSLMLYVSETKLNDQSKMKKARCGSPKRARE